MKTWIGIAITYVKTYMIVQDWYPMLLREMRSRVIRILEACGPASLA